MHELHFHPDLIVETSRPELLGACVALVCHPDDERYRSLVGTHARTPLFGREVPIHAHPLADPEKGSGLVMVCTFGDLNDVTWWRELQLPVRALMQADGTLGPLGGQLAGLDAVSARKRIAELLAETGELGATRPVTHPVKFYEKGERPLEIITSRQWFIRSMDHREALIAAGEQIRWHPPHMQVRYENWVRGLTGDWCISRQRHFGVAFPLWYRLDEAARPDHDDPIRPDPATLPIDPSADTPPGYASAQRDRPGGFSADPDVMDTWATSSLTPQIIGGADGDPDLFERVYPMDLRPQAHEIIRTWLFSTVLRALLADGRLPFAHAAISGWIVDPDRRKMSKSKGNVTTPMAWIERYGADAVRYWAARARLGADTAFTVTQRHNKRSGQMEDANEQMEQGRRLAVKLLNASRFILSADAPAGPVTEAMDRAQLARLAQTVDQATAAFESFDSARALELTESAFWDFTDNYLELTKSRSYGELGEAGRASAHATLRECLSSFQRLLAPFLPYCCEETWSWWQPGSIHRAAWPVPPVAAAAARSRRSRRRAT